MNEQWSVRTFRFPFFSFFLIRSGLVWVRLSKCKTVKILVGWMQLYSACAPKFVNGKTGLGQIWLIHGVVIYNGVTWSSMEVQWSSMEFNGVQWSSMEFNGVQWSSMESNGVQLS